MPSNLFECTSLKNSRSKKNPNKFFNKGRIYLSQKFDFYGNLISQSPITRKQYLNLRFKEYIDNAYSRFAKQNYAAITHTPEPVNVSSTSLPLFSKLGNFTKVISFSFIVLLTVLLFNLFSSTFLANLFNNTFVLNSLNISFTIAILSLFLFIYLKSDSILNKVGKVVLPLTFLAMPVMAQNQVTGHVESVPSKTDALARVTMINLSNNQNYNTLTDITDGTFELNLPTGTYHRKVEVQNHFLFEDTLDINASQYMDLQTIEDLGKETTVYNNILEVVKVLTVTRDPPLSMNTIMERWHDEDQPIIVYKRNYDVNDPQSMPPNFAVFMDSAINDIFRKSDGKVVFSESQTPVDIGINFLYVISNEMPIPGSIGYTLIEERYPDDSPKKAKIYINRELQSNRGKNGVFRREFMRTMETTNDALDPMYIMGWLNQIDTLHNDEGKALQIMYTLNNLTDMKKHKYTVIQDPVPVELTSFNAFTDDNIVKLLWNTATEVNNYGFEIQRKTEKWDSIGFVHGNGNSNSPKNYAFADTLEMPGVYTYRLKQVDNDGKTEYSPEVAVDLTKIIKDYIIMQNYPNPFNPETSIKFKIPQTSHIKLTVYDVLGKEVETLMDETLEPGTYNETFNGKNLSSGMYIYRLQTENSNVSGKMLLMK